MRALEPAEVDIPRHIQKIGVANRSLPPKDINLLNILEGFVTGESILGDREASTRTVEGLATRLNNSPRFTAVVLYGLDLRGTGTKKFPEPLNWGEVDRLCQQYGVDALALLETFDSDLLLDKKTRQVKRTREGKEYEVTEHLARLNIRVNSGWRIYDAKEKRIVDANVYTDEKGWEGRGDNPDQALSKLPDKRRAINDAALFSGERYGVRISPTWVNITRQYYSRGHDDLKKAKVYVKRRNYDPAMDIWKRLALHADPKIAGMAAFNMAVICEVQGEYDLALSWANKSLREFNNKKASGYIQTLNARKARQARLDRQMGQ